MSTIKVNGPTGPEEVHLLRDENGRGQEAAELKRCEQVAQANANRREKNRLTAIALIAGLVLLIGLGQNVWDRPYSLEFYPVENELKLIRTHWVRANGWMLLRRQYDRDYGERGWCVWAALPDEKPRWHLIVRDGGETLMPTHPSWWKN